MCICKHVKHTALVRVHLFPYWLWCRHTFSGMRQNFPQRSLWAYLHYCARERWVTWGELKETKMEQNLNLNQNFRLTNLGGRICASGIGAAVSKNTGPSIFHLSLKIIFIKNDLRRVWSHCSAWRALKGSTCSTVWSQQNDNGVI